MEVAGHSLLFVGSCIIWYSGHRNVWLNGEHNNLSQGPEKLGVCKLQPVNSPLIRES